jgi:DNA-directed RNA polymerase subunit N (RpoN/RPB10)
MRQRFYDAVAYAEKNYGEKGRAALPGWKTDRGRVYVRNGAPEEMLDRLHQRSPPYQWRYRQGKDRWFVFADRASASAIISRTGRHQKTACQLARIIERSCCRRQAVSRVDFFDRTAGTGYMPLSGWRDRLCRMGPVSLCSRRAAREPTEPFREGVDLRADPTQLYLELAKQGQVSRWTAGNPLTFSYGSPTKAPASTCGGTPPSSRYVGDTTRGAGRGGAGSSSS